MVNVNGREFANFSEAINYMQTEKEKEDKACRENKLDNLFNETLNITVVRFKEKNYLVCTMSFAENKVYYNKAAVEEIFGRKYVISHRSGSLRQRYEVTKPSDIAGIKEFLKSNIDPKSNQTIWRNVSIGNEFYEGVYLFNYTVPQEDERTIGSERMMGTLNELFALMEDRFLR